MRKAILRFIDFFYPPFSRWISPHTFRYIATGGTTMVAGVVVYYIAYNIILKQEDVQIKGMPLITAPIAALAIESLLTFLIGFLLNKYLVFTQSNLKGRIQLFRYGSVVATNILLNYAFIKVLVEAFSFYPTVAKLVTSLILAVFSYFSQKHFSFKVKK
ncbi:GtrA family protein [Pedobacter duraquae]|uniref:GtrA-like protein n=1 Tax=Pedobacter duraquae TaxID=425511 RepID=A0A4R6ILR8_9SPHI|nr:GtrA family protein [Pedobacter duraquae]TDO23053.1 GtrA-like protein [Pedobacter duraquae]